MTCTLTTMSATPSDGQPREIKKRPRPVISCLQCRQKKLKCDRLLPCQQCIKGGRTQLCAYAEGQEPELRQDAGEANDAAPRQPQLHGKDVSPGLLTSSGQVNEVLDRLKSLEQALQTHRGGFHSGDNDAAPRTQITHSKGSSTATSNDLLSDWKGEDYSMESFPLAFQFIQSLSQHHHDPEIVHVARESFIIQSSLQRHKHRVRAPYSETQACLNHMLQILPDQGVCEVLINTYFENFEHCTRVLHKPSFVKAYKDSVSDLLPKSDLQNFIPLLVGTLSVASLLNTLEECELPLLRGDQDGVGAMQLLQNWIDLQTDETRYNIPTMQTKLLLLLSMKLQGYDDRALWATSGQLVRDAMVMDLHRPPRADLGILTREIRKRLWVSIIELDLAHAVCLALPANATTLHEACIPMNIDDNDISDQATANISSRTTNEWTDGLCQHILGQSFNMRLDAYNYSFNRGPLRYTEVLSKAKELEHVVFTLPSTFKFDHNNPPGRLLAQMEVDISLRRPLIALYTPFALSMPTDDRYKDARVGCVQANLVILCFQDLFDPKFPAIEVPRPEGYWDLYYTVYKMDDFRALHAEVLEFQRMKDPLQKDLTGLNPGLQQHPHRSGSRALPWTVKGMDESIEDTLDPLIRRIGREGSDLGVVLRYQLVYDSLRCDDERNVDFCMCTGLKTVLRAIRTRLESQGHILNSDDSINEGYPKSTQDLLHWFAKFLNGKEV